MGLLIVQKYGGSSEADAEKTRVLAKADAERLGRVRHGRHDPCSDTGPRPIVTAVTRDVRRAPC